MTSREGDPATEQSLAKYGMQVPREIVSSVLIGQPKVPVLLSRAAFRPHADTRNDKVQTQLQQGRRRFLHTMLGLAAISIAGLWLLKGASAPSTQPTTPSPTINSPSSQASLSSPLPATTPAPTTYTGQPVANAANIPLNQSLTLNDPTLGPIVLIHLDNGQFVAYSAICTHAGCEVQFDPSAKDIACPCHGAVYNPYNNAQVVGGPAPYPLQKIPIQYDASTGNLYLTG
ncbi:MAG TPA: Rieske 2Fe-2S domain-containing protein [Methylomirabilota bacterium]|nr:Rieske 2Fe-2S domain-containing protein [Methylomirabilota bacterium]